MKNTHADFHFSNHFSLWLVSAENADANTHLHEHVTDEATWVDDHTLAVEPRYVEGLAENLSNDGFEVSHA